MTARQTAIATIADRRVAQTEVLTLGSELLEEPTTVVRVVL